MPKNFEETREQTHKQIRSVVPPAEIRYYEGDLYLSDKGIDLLLEACENDQLPAGKDTGWRFKASLTVMLRSHEMLFLLRDLIATGDADAALLLHCHMIRHEMFRK